MMQTKPLYVQNLSAPSRSYDKNSANTNYWHPYLIELSAQEQIELKKRLIVALKENSIAPKEGEGMWLDAENMLTVWYGTIERFNLSSTKTQTLEILLIYLLNNYHGGVFEKYEKETLNIQASRRHPQANLRSIRLYRQVLAASPHSRLSKILTSQPSAKLIASQLSNQPSIDPIHTGMPNSMSSKSSSVFGQPSSMPSTRLSTQSAQCSQTNWNMTSSSMPWIRR